MYIKKTDKTDNPIISASTCFRKEKQQTIKTKFFSNKNLQLNGLRYSLFLILQDWKNLHQILSSTRNIQTMRKKFQWFLQEKNKKHCFPFWNLQRKKWHNKQFLTKPKRSEESKHLQWKKKHFEFDYWSNLKWFYEKPMIQE